MLSEEKIKLMTNLAMFEKNEGKHIFPINGYFKSDYISSKMFRSFFNYTLSFILCAVLFGLYYIEQWMNAMNVDSMLRLGIQAGAFYIAGLVVYLIISFRIYSKIYGYASRGNKVYLAKLKRLDKRYESGPRAGARTKGGRGQ